MISINLVMGRKGATVLKMKISEIIMNKYKLRIPPTVYYDLLADVQEVEEDQESTTKNDHHRQNIQAYAHDFGVSEEQAEKELRVTTKNDLGVDCISREQALVAIRNLYPSMPRVDFNGSLRKWVDKYKPYIECDDAIKQLPSVTPQPRCKECKWWKDSDGEYRRGCGAESKCPINRREIFEGSGYCYLFEPQESED